MKNITKMLNNIFEKKIKLEREKTELDKKFDKLYSKIDNIAFELYKEFIKTNQNFNHNVSPHRKNHIVSVYLGIAKSDYESSGVVIDKNQYDRLSKEFTINIRM